MISRREMLGRAGVGLGAVGLASLWASASPARPSGGPLSPRLAHFAPRAKRIIHVYMNGGPSQVDTFDYKPALKTYQGQRPEITAKLLKQGIAIHEVPISYHGRSFAEGKKISWKDFISAVWTLLTLRVSA